MSTLPPVDKERALENVNIVVTFLSGLQTFLVRKSTSLQKKVISVRMNKDSAVPVKDFPVKESQYCKWRLLFSLSSA